ncbi:MAG: HEAT repeat domain-containing protein [Polyangiaceae bacterium]|nr:HEAT repeat domain-containing protein [Polyangiaceae bacterium]
MSPAEVARALASAEPEERRLGAAHLGLLPAREAAPLLPRALADADWRVRKEAVLSAIRQEGASEVLDALLGALAPGDDVGLRNAAVEALAGSGLAAVTRVARAAPGLDEDGRKLAAEALGRSGLPEALPALQALARDPDPNVRVAAVDAVGLAGAVAPERAAPVLLLALDAGPVVERISALDGLTRLGVALPWERLEALRGAQELRRSVLEAAALIDDPRAAPFLVEAFATARGTLRTVALVALDGWLARDPARFELVRRALHAREEDATALLLEAVRSPDELTRRAAFSSAAALRTAPCVRALVDAMADPRVAGSAELALLHADEVAAAALAAALTDGPSELAARRIELLGRLAVGEASASVSAALGARLADASPAVLSATLRALGAVGEAPALVEVAPWVDAEDPLLAKAAVASLSDLARRHPAAARALVHGQGASIRSLGARVVVIGALGGSGASPEDDLRVLTDALSTGAPPLRAAALDSLAVVGTSRAVEAAEFALGDEEWSVQRAAVRALGRIRLADGRAPGGAVLLRLLEAPGNERLHPGAARALAETGDPEAFAKLRALIASRSPVVAVAAVDALATFDDPRRLDALFAALDHDEPEVVKAALHGLAGAVDPRVVAHLGVCLEHPAWDVRRLAADLLGAVGSDSAHALLRAHQGKESEPLVRESIQRALGGRDAYGRRSSPPPPHPGRVS